MFWLLLVAVVTLTGGFDLQHGQGSPASALGTTALKCTIFELGTWNRQTDRWKTASLNAPHFGGGA